MSGEAIEDLRASIAEAEARRQLDRELAEWDAAKTQRNASWLKLRNRGEAARDPALARLVDAWVGLVEAKIGEARTTAPRRGPKPAWQKIELEDGELAALSVTALFNVLHRPGAATIAGCATAIGYAITDQLRFRQFRERHPAVFGEYVKRLKKSGVTSLHGEIVLSHGASKMGINPMNKVEVAAIGLAFFHITTAALGGRIQVAPAPTTKRLKSGRGIRANPQRVFLDDETQQWVSQAVAQASRIRRSPSAMVCVPISWVHSEGKGGYLLPEGGVTSPVKNASGPSARASKRLAAAAPPIEVYFALDTLGFSALRINRNVLTLIQEAMERGVPMPGLPQSHALMGLPVVPADVATNEDARREYRQARARAEERNVHIRCAQLGAWMAIEEARELVDEPVLYYPHAADFRGRMYPIASKLVPHGNDMQRALFQFARPTQVGLGNDTDYYRGLSSLLKGAGSMTWQEREKKVRDRLSLMHRVAARPFEHLDTIKKAGIDEDKLWQFIAACYDADSVQSTGHSQIPLWLDGTCNGLQHYAALTRDRTLAHYVNLCPSSEPEDIYHEVGVATFQEIRRLAHAHTPNPMAYAWHRIITRWMENGGSLRKLAKAPVMTYAYGATAIANFDQIGNLFTDGDLYPWIRTEPERFKAITFVTTLMRRQMLGYVASAEALTQWLRKCVGIVYDMGYPFKHRIDWTTPTGWPWSLHYGEMRWRRTTASVSGAQHAAWWMERDTRGKPKKQAQRQAIAPNFIQALDASALVYALSLHSPRPVIAIHDSLGVRAADYRLAHENVRRGFHHLYTCHDPLSSFYAAIKEHVPQKNRHLIPAPPKPGDYHVDDVIYAPYFFN